MAEAFKKLYDTTLNQGHLNDGEQTLLSNGNNKVIKQISITSPDIALKNTYLELDVRKTRYLDHDIIEILEDFVIKAKERNIQIKLYSEKGIIENPDSYIEFFKKG